MEKAINFLDSIGYISTAIVLISFLGGLWAWMRGILPVLLAFGSGLANRKIAMFAKGDNLTSMRNLLLDSKLIRKKNIIEVSSTNDLGRSEIASIFLVFFHDWYDCINQILAKKSDRTALILYAPRELGDIPKECMKQVGELRNTTVTNFRGRLLNDIVTSMITTNK